VLEGQVFDDVGPAFARWFNGGIELAIYSSGSELAQRRLFETTPEGDLTRFISRFFDTAMGPKVSADSYRRIARSLDRPPGQILFVSDTAAELDAARSAGWLAASCFRPRTLNPEPDHPEPGVRHSESATLLVHRFDEIVL
jgi:enolase-phosphatase E1